MEEVSRGEGQKTTVVWQERALDSEVRKDQKGKTRKRLREELKEIR